MDHSAGTTRLVSRWNPSLPTDEQRDRKVAAFVAVLCLAGAVACAAWAIGTTWRTRGWRETAGTVLDVSSYSTIGFRDSDGIAYEFRSDVITGLSDGDVVSVVYPPRDPQRAEMHDEATSDRAAGLVVGALLVTFAIPFALRSAGLVG